MAGKAFKDIPRPLKSGAGCPEGTVACPGAASETPENMICYPIEEHAKNCPITDIIFLQDDKMPPAGYSQSKIFVDGYAVAYSKTAKDNLPI
jgi:hypothetical protein